MSKRRGLVCKARTVRAPIIVYKTYIVKISFKAIVQLSAFHLKPRINLIFFTFDQIKKNFILQVDNLGHV